MPETRQVSGVPAGVSPGLDGAPVAGERHTRIPGSEAFGTDLGGAEFLRWGRACVAALECARAEIDGLNVFPVPDSDTGRNLLATMRAAVAEAAAAVDGVAGQFDDGAGEPPAGAAAGGASRGAAVEQLNGGTRSGGAGDRPGHIGVAPATGIAPGGDAGGGAVEDTGGEPVAGIAGPEGGAPRGAAAGTADPAERPATMPTGAISGGTVSRGGRPVESVHRYAAAMARGATAGARGNSGIILSQVLRGIAESTAGRRLTGETYRDGLARASALVRDSLSEPVEGTILTVLDRASDAARECLERGLAEVAFAAAEGAARALEQTRDQLAVLRAAGVVDAGARGLLVLLDTMVAVVTGTPPVRRAYPPAAEMPGTGRGPAVSGQMRYEVMFRIADADARRAAELRSRLAQLGDSVVVAADGAGGWTTHVHCAEAGAAVEAGIAVGAVRDIRIEYLAESPGPADTFGAGRAGQVAAGPMGRCAAGGRRFHGGPAQRSAPEPAPAGEEHEVATDAAGAGRGARAVPAEVDAAGYGVWAGNGSTDSGRGASANAVGTDAVGGVRSAAVGGCRAAPVNIAVGDPGVQSWAAGASTEGGDPGAAAAPSGGVDCGPHTVANGITVDRGVLAVAAGPGATGLFEAAGAVVLDAEQAPESSTLLAAILEMPHREVLVLPNGALPAHELVAVGVAARNTHRDVLLLPSASMVQGLAAMAVHDRARIAVDDAFAMSEAAAGTRWGALRRAEERALTMVGTCAPGDGLGLVGHDVVVIDRDTRAAGHTLLDRMLGLGGELVTLLVGAGAPEGLAADLARHIGAEFPGVEVSVYSGGQRGDLIQIGVE